MFPHSRRAGNHGDVLKHAVWSMLLARLTTQSRSVRVIDTHAGAGSYQLSQHPDASWRQGVGRLLDADLTNRTASLLFTYLGMQRREPGRYAGSPLISCAHARHVDQVVLCEKHDAARSELSRQVGGLPVMCTIKREGWPELVGVSPGAWHDVILVDPPFDDARDWSYLTNGVTTMPGVNPRATVVSWYPVAELDPLSELMSDARRTITDTLCVELELRPRDGRFVGSGLLITNPPPGLAEDVAVALPELAAAMADPRHAPIYRCGPP